MRAFTVHFSLVCVLFHYWRPVFFLLWLLLFRATVFILFALRLFSLSLTPSMCRRLCCGASAIPVVSVSLTVLHSPASLSPSLSSVVRGSLSTTCCACLSPLPLLVSCLPPWGFGVRFRVPPSSFPHFSLAGSCLGGWVGVHPSVPSFMGFLFRWQCSSLAWAIGSYGYSIDFLGSCCSPSLIGVVNLFLVLTPSPVCFGPFYGSVSFLSPSLSFAVCF